MIKEINSFLDKYFDLIQNQDLDLYEEVFHENASLYSQQDGKTVVRSRQEYKEIVKNRKSPVSLGSPRFDEVLLIDILSPEMALVKVRLKLFENVMVDYLNIIKVNGKWSIIAKHYHRQN